MKLPYLRPEHDERRYAKDGNDAGPDQNPDEIFDELHSSPGML
jgi:hypothetical protein